MKTGNTWRVNFGKGDGKEIAGRGSGDGRKTGGRRRADWAMN